MWEPRASLGPVDAELLEPRVDVCRQPTRLAAWVFEDEHAHRARLAVAHRPERERDRLASGFPQNGDDRVKVGAWARPEEGERDVKALDRASALEVPLSPADERVNHVVGKLEIEKEPEPVIPTDGSGSVHA